MFYFPQLQVVAAVQAGDSPVECKIYGTSSTSSAAPFPVMLQGHSHYRLSQCH